MDSVVLDVQGLETRIVTQKGLVRAVDKVSLRVGKGEIVGIVGESGSGKTTLALSIVRMLPRNAYISSGKIFLNGRELTGLDEKEMTHVRGKEIGMIFQDPSSFLNPLMRVGIQISEVMELHLGLDRKDAMKKVVDLMKKLGIINPESVVLRYPFELSGGMKQRVMIAMAIAANPSLVIADEPTSNLDSTTQVQVANILREAINESKTSLLLITHNLGLVAWICQKIGVFYAGRLVEFGDTETVLTRPAHPYTLALINSIPSLQSNNVKFSPIAGDTPSLVNLREEQCHFHTRCPYAFSECKQKRPELSEVENGHYSACFISKEILGEVT
jgi:oligopeptide/dipeptide ABC transporter ATP-binding protein